MGILHLYGPPGAWSRLSYLQTASSPRLVGDKLLSTASFPRPLSQMKIPSHQSRLKTHRSHRCLLPHFPRLIESRSFFSGSPLEPTHETRLPQSSTTLNWSFQCFTRRQFWQSADQVSHGSWGRRCLLILSALTTASTSPPSLCCNPRCRLAQCSQSA